MTAVKYLPYPPLGRVEFYCPNCTTTVVAYSHYPEACEVTAVHRCRRTLRVKELMRR